ncbi:MAG: hypothetical protein WDA47_05980 [Bacilli bacterium]|jgi:hypothetical protein
MTKQETVRFRETLNKLFRSTEDWLRISAIGDDIQERLERVCELIILIREIFKLQQERLKRVISETDNLLLKEIQLEYKIMDNQLGVSSGIIDELSNTCIIQNELAGKLLNLLAEEFGEFESLVEVGEWNLQEKNRRALSPEGEEVQKLCREQQSYDFKTFEMGL